MSRRIIGITALVILIVLVACICLFAFIPRTKPPQLFSHGKSKINLSLDHIPTIPKAYRDQGSIVFPVYLFNGNLPLLMLHVGESSSKAAAIVDTASDNLLLGDIDRCMTCSTKLYGGARGSDSEPTHVKDEIVFGSQKDQVEYRTEDVYIDEFYVPKIPYGLVIHRESLTKDTHVTYNIMGVGGAQKIQKSFIRELHNRLRPKQPLVIGFKLHESSKFGEFVLGPLNLVTPKIEIPLDQTPFSPYGYSTQCIQIRTDDQIYKIPKIPVLFDTGSNFAEFPMFLKDDFHKIQNLYLKFSNSQELQIPKKALKWNRFAETDHITLGSIVFSCFHGLEFYLTKPSPKLIINI